MQGGGLSMTVRRGREGEGALLLKERLAEAEKRVRKVVSDNHHLRSRVLELEQELGQARKELQDLQVSRGKRSEIRGRLQRILADLESLKTQDRQEAPDQPSED